MTRVLVVDDEPPILRALSANLRARGYDVDLAATGEAALELAARHHPDVVVLDLGPPRHRRRRGHPRPAGLEPRADHRPLRPRRRAGQGRGARRRRRRLRGQAVRHGRAPGSRCGPPSDGRSPPPRRPSSRPRTSPSTWPPRRSRPGRARRSASLPPSGTCSRCSCAIGAGWSPAPAAPGGVGAGVRRGEQLPAGPHGAPPGQARARAVPAPLPPHRARHGLPVRRVLSSPVLV